jgi:N-acetylneuraminic acid mutarotase
MQPSGEGQAAGEAPDADGDANQVGNGDGAQPGAGSDGEQLQTDDLPLTPAGADDDAEGRSEPPPAADDPVTTDPVEQPLPDLPAVRQEHAVVALAGEIYVIGGFTPNATASVEVFDPQSETWRDAADLPTALHHANAAVIDGTLYVAGFYVGGSFTNVSGAVLAYDPAGNDWSEIGQMPAGTERASSCVTTLGTRIYLFGGARADSVSDSSFYDVATGDWQEVPDLPEPREHCVAASIDGMLYVAAGRTDSIAGVEGNTWAFDPDAETYSPRAAIPTPRGGVAGAVVAGRLYVFGGEGSDDDPNGVFPDVEAYDPASDGWLSLPDMLVPRHGFAAAAIGSRIYLPGGATAEGFGASANASVVIFDVP